MGVKTNKNSKWKDIERLKNKGFSVLEIAFELKISPQGIYDHYNRRKKHEK